MATMHIGTHSPPEAGAPVDEVLTPRRLATRQRLVKAAAVTFARKGVLGASVEEICDEAGFTRGAFYSNFASRDELCLALLQAHADRYLVAARQALERLEPTESVDELLNQALGVFLSAVSAEPNDILAMNELRLYAAREPAIREAYRALDEQLTPAFSSLIGDGLTRFGLHLAAPADELVGLLHAVYDQSSLDELISGGSANSPRVGARLAAVLRAVVTPAAQPA